MTLSNEEQSLEEHHQKDNFTSMFNIQFLFNYLFKKQPRISFHIAFRLQKYWPNGSIRRPLKRAHQTDVHS